MRGSSAYERMLWEHSHSKQLCYPTTASAAAAVNVPTNALADTYGAWVQIIPASTYSEEFDIHFMSVLDLPAVDDYIFQISVGAANEIVATIPISKAAAQAANNEVPIITAKTDANWLENHGKIPPTDAVYARVQRATAGAVNCHLFLCGHEY